MSQKHTLFCPLFPPRYRNRLLRGFTLTELLVVVAVIGILAAILVPVTSGVRKGAQATKAVNNIRQFGMAALLFANENGGMVPGRGNVPGGDGMGLEGRLFPYLTGRAVEGWPDLMRTYRAIRDPSVPFEISKGGEIWGWTGVSNAIFNQFPDPDNPSVLPPGRRLNNFDVPSAVIYAASGSDTLLPRHATDPAQLPLPKAERQGFYFAHNGATPAVFLDGHAAMLEFPIDPTWLNPNFIP